MAIIDNIFFIYLNSGYGGAQTYILRKSEWLISKGYKVTIFCYEGPMVEIYKKAQAKVILVKEKLPILALVKNEINSLVCDLLRQNIDRIPRVIECFDPNSLCLAEAIGQKYNSKILVSLLSKRIFDKKSKIIFENYEKSNAVYAINKACAMYPETEFQINKLPIIRVPIKIPPLEMHNEENGAIVTLLSISRHDKGKEYTRGLINIFDSLSRKYPDKLYLELIGDGPLHESFKKKYLNSQYKDRICFLGFIEPKKIDKYIEKCSIYIGCGTTALHAARLGKPVVISFGGNENCESPGYFSDLEDDSFGESNTGISTKSTENLIDSLIKDPTLRKKIGTSCYLKTKQMFDIEYIMPQWLKFIDNATPPDYRILNKERSKMNFHRFLLRKMHSEGSIGYILKKINKLRRFMISIYSKIIIY